MVEQLNATTPTLSHVFDPATADINELLVKLEPSIGRVVTSHELENISAKQLFGDNSRFLSSKVLSYGDATIRVTTLETWERITIPAPTAGQDRFYTITAGMQFRSDKISNLVYNTSNLDWWIKFANDIIDEEELTVGKTLRLPPAPRNT